MAKTLTQDEILTQNEFNDLNKVYKKVRDLSKRDYIPFPDHEKETALHNLKKALLMLTPQIITTIDHYFATLQFVEHECKEMDPKNISDPVPNPIERAILHSYKNAYKNVRSYLREGNDSDTV